MTPKLHQQQLPLRFLLIAATFLFAGCAEREKKGADARVPTDSRIHELIPPGWGTRFLLLGRVTVMSGSSYDFNNHKISEDHLKEVVAWTKAGLATIDSSREIAGKDSENFWADWMRLTQGQKREITVRLTEKGKRIDSEIRAELGESQPSRASARFFTDRIDQILSKEIQERAATTYCIVRTTITRKYTDIGRQISETVGWPLHKKLKMVTLLKYDDFEKTWNEIAADVAFEGEEITTNNVNEALLNAK